LFFKRIKVFVSFWSAFDWEQFNSQKYIYSFFWTKIQILFDLFSFLISLSCITLCDTLYPFFGSKFFFEYSLLFCSTQSLSFGYLFRIEISLVQFLLTLFTCFKYLKKRRKNNICIHLHPHWPLSTIIILHFIFVLFFHVINPFKLTALYFYFASYYTILFKLLHLYWLT